MKSTLTPRLFFLSFAVTSIGAILFLLISQAMGAPSSNEDLLPEFADKPWASDLCQSNMTKHTKSVSFFEWHCDVETLKEEAQGSRITNTFSIPSGMMARRAQFWKRIYTVFDNHEYVLHTSAYPEVIIGFATAANEKLSRKEVRKQRKHYRNILKSMDKISPERWSLSQKNIARAMAHISDRNKFTKAANSLRTQRGQKTFLKDGLAISKKYLPHIKSSFRAEGVPEEISYIAFVESSFNTRARSKVGASGIFQIMPNVGRQYMRVDQKGGIDERNDPIKAGKVAAKIFRANLRLTKSWPLAITGYNHGAYGMKRIAKRLGTSDLAVMIEKYHRGTFGFASKNFYIQFLTMVSIMENENQYFETSLSTPVLAYKNHKLKKSRSPKWISKNFNTPMSDIIKLNPDISSHKLKRNSRLPRNYIIKVANHQRSD